jgi:formate hydrogenlyase subunit 6/NADH:ubiquinone oxidoreductase subunit I
MADRWDEATQTFDIDVGRCLYCNETVYKNPDRDIKYRKTIYEFHWT